MQAPWIGLGPKTCDEPCYECEVVQCADCQEVDSECAMQECDDCRKLFCGEHIHDNRTRKSGIRYSCFACTEERRLGARVWAVFR
jgi:hypothetical protein